MVVGQSAMPQPSAVPLRCGLLALVVAVATCLAIRLQHIGDEGCGEPGGYHPGPAEDRLREYCHPPVGLGAEGRPPHAGLELRAVVLTIRHGDRSAIHDAPGSLPHRGRGFSCEAGDLQAVWSGLPQRFRVLSTDTGKPLRRPFSPPAKKCGPGQLTSRGFRQHLALGSHLQEAYRPFVSDLQSSRGVLYVRSTKHSRTISSAAAMLTSLLPEQLWPGRIAIEVNEDEGAEIMHGAGIRRRQGSRAGDGNVGQASMEGACPAAVRHGLQQFFAWKRPEAEYAHLRALYGDAVENRSITEFADAMLAASCHGLPLPCGPGGCAGRPLALLLAHRADELYCARFAGAEGGARATQLSFYLFIREMLTYLDAAAVVGAPPVLAIFSGHDTVIAPVLSALGVYRGRLCRWPPYGSRIALELYRAPGRTVGHFVRLLYNGEALVGMRGCGTKVLCPLEDFANGVASLLGGAADWDTACAV